MTIRECYEKIGGDFDGVLKRLGSEALVQRFAVKFVSDTSFSELKAGVEAQDAEKAFRGAHTLKGVCLNLGLDSLYSVSSELTESLRNRKFEDGYKELLSKVEEEYLKTVDAIKEYSEQ